MCDFIKEMSWGELGGRDHQQKKGEVYSLWRDRP